MPEGKVRTEPQLFQKITGSSAVRRPAGLKQPTFSWIHRVYAWCKAEIWARARLALWASGSISAELDICETRPHPRRRGVQSVPR